MIIESMEDREELEKLERIIEKVKLIGASLIILEVAVCDTVVAVRFLNIMNYYGLLDYVLSLTNEALIQGWQYFWQLLTG